MKKSLIDILFSITIFYHRVTSNLYKILFSVNIIYFSYIKYKNNIYDAFFEVLLLFIMYLVIYFAVYCYIMIKLKIDFEKILDKDIQLNQNSDFKDSNKSEQHNFEIIGFEIINFFSVVLLLIDLICFINFNQSIISIIIKNILNLLSLFGSNSRY